MYSHLMRRILKTYVAPSESGPALLSIWLPHFEAITTFCKFLRQELLLNHQKIVQILNGY